MSGTPSDGGIVGPNGERLSVQVGGKSIGIAAKDLVSVLLLLMMGIGGYLIFVNVNANLERLYGQNVAFQANQQQALGEFQGILRTTIGQCTEIHSGNSNAVMVLLRSNNEALREILHGQNEKLEGQTHQIHKWFVIHQYNQGRELPDQLPLDVDVPRPPPR